MTTPFDLIGDVHGHADQLEALLQKLNYEKRNGAYQHPERKALFLGDYIDRGPDSPRVVNLVRAMVDAGSALALMGNHEYNAICFHTPKEGGGYLRPHTEKNIHQQKRTLAQYAGRPDELDAAIEWFKTLPLYFETPHLRAVHACWDAAVIDQLQEVFHGGRIPEELLPATADSATPLFQAVEVTCKGKEVPLPAGVSFHDKDGNERQDMRIKWWQNPAGKSFQEMSVMPVEGLDHLPFSEPSAYYYPEHERPVFFGHYWLQGQPDLQSTNACCLDYSVAEGGVLTAYRFEGEADLDESKLVWV
jgi:hypothetical protein